MSGGIIKINHAMELRNIEASRAHAERLVLAMREPFFFTRAHLLTSLLTGSDCDMKDLITVILFCFTPLAARALKRQANNSKAPIKISEI